MEIKDVRNYLMFEAVAGSHAYGTSTPESDLDIRGIFCLPKSHFVGLETPVNQVEDKSEDIVFWELRRYFELASNCNPNLIEVLFTPDDCIRFCSKAMKLLLQNRDKFLSKKAYYSFSGYAVAQIKRCRGQNKWVNNAKPETPPDKLDYCWFVDVRKNAQDFSFSDYDNLTKMNRFPFRPVSLKDGECFIPGESLMQTLGKCHIACLEHFPNAYRVYYYPDSGKGVFRGPHQQLVVESIPKDEEWQRFVGILIFNEQDYEREYKDWKNYWEWREKRNEARYRSQESGELDYDAKNILHCMRLLWSGRNILENNEPIVRFTGERVEFLRKIRQGVFTYDEIMARVETEMSCLDDMKDKSDLRKTVNMKELNRLYLELLDYCENGDGLKSVELF